MDQIKSIQIDKLEASPYQGRLVRKEIKPGKSDDPAMKKLKESIEKNGLMTPVIVRKKVNGKYEIIDGHRRVEACRRLKIETVEAIVRDYTEEKTQIFSIVGNLMRQNLNLIEKAIAFKRILDSNEITQKDFAAAIGKNETFVSEVIGTLDMDNRIIEDLKREDGIKDVRLLRAIRKVDKANDNVSDKQFDIYLECKNGKKTRKEVIEEVKSSKGEVAPFRIDVSNKSFSVHLSKAITDEQKEEIKEYLNGKMNEWMHAHDD